YDPAATARFAMDASVPPLIVRVPGAAVGTEGRLLDVSPEGAADVHLKRAADGHGLIAHLRNLAAAATTVTLAPQLDVSAAWVCTPVEENVERLPVDDGRVTVTLPPRGIVCVRLEH
ncbi:MAG: hypothetical protein KDD83_25160, partial [Caldilineaceae bacterium]|nr:hypothetical protein [Caldilineaceae bacterium]